MGSTRATALFLSVLLLLLPAVFSASLNPITNRATNAIAAGQYLSNAYILELDLSTPGLVKRDSTPDSVPPSLPPSKRKLTMSRVDPYRRTLLHRP